MSEPLPEGPKSHAPVGGGLEGEGGSLRVAQAKAGEAHMIQVQSNVSRALGLAEALADPIDLDSEGFAVRVAEVAQEIVDLLAAPLFLPESQTTAPVAPSFEGEREEGGASRNDVDNAVYDGRHDEGDGHTDGHSGPRGRGVRGRSAVLRPDNESVGVVGEAGGVHPGRRGVAPDGPSVDAASAAPVAAASLPEPEATALKNVSGEREGATPDEIEVAARAIYESQWPFGDWDVQTEHDKSFQRKWATVALQAVAEAQPKARIEGGQPAVGNDEFEAERLRHVIHDTLRLLDGEATVKGDKSFAATARAILNGQEKPDPDPFGYQDMCATIRQLCKDAGTGDIAFLDDAVGAIVAERDALKAAIDTRSEAPSPVLYDELREALKDIQDELHSWVFDSAENFDYQPPEARDVAPLIEICRAALADLSAPKEES